MRGVERYYALLSGAYPQLSRAELRALLDVEAAYYRVNAWLEGAADFTADGLDPGSMVSRAAYVREVGILLAYSEPDPESMARALEASRVAELLGEGARVRVEVARFKGYLNGVLDHAGVVSSLARALARMGLSPSPRGGRILRVYASEGVALLGLALERLETKQFASRRPGARPFFKPGPLDPQLSRAFVNLSRMRRGDVYLDPFCGTGGFVIEACLIGASRCLCSDIDRAMVGGSRINLEHYSCWNAAPMEADAAAMPVVGEAVDAVATDPPYGRSTTLARRSREDLYRAFLGEAARVLRPGGWLAFAAPEEAGPAELASEAGLLVIDYVEMYVHSSLTRAIVAARKPGGGGGA